MQVTGCVCYIPVKFGVRPECILEVTVVFREFFLFFLDYSFKISYFALKIAAINFFCQDASIDVLNT
jgi:hypothetical protein